MDEQAEQLVFERILKGQQERQPQPQEKPSQSDKKRKRKPATKPSYEVVLIHEQEVEWRLECWQQGGDELEPGYYDHLAVEALKKELLRILKQPEPKRQEVYIVTLILKNLGAEVPDLLMVDTNKNLFEGDFWCDFEELKRLHYGACSRSFFWAFYFKDFSPNQRVVQRSFNEYPAHETDLGFLLDHELVLAKYPGLALFVG